MPPQEKFKDWLARELSVRGWKPFHLAKRAGVNASTILNLLDGKKGVGPDTARAIAHAFEMPELTVFLAAGLLTEAPADLLNSHPVKASIARLVDHENQETVLLRMMELSRIAVELGPDADAETFRKLVEFIRSAHGLGQGGSEDKPANGDEAQPGQPKKKPRPRPAHA